MSKKEKPRESLVPTEPIEKQIFLIRGHKVMLDRDLAQLYGVETRALNQAVRRNIERFPSDFMFQLSPEEAENWKSQIVISIREKMGLRKMPLAFTEQGVAMLSSVLKSKRAIQVNIMIMRAFVRLKQKTSAYTELTKRLKDLERYVGKHDKEIRIIFQAIRQLVAEPKKPKRRIGFHAE